MGGRDNGHYNTLIKYNNSVYLYDDSLIDKIENFKFSKYKEKYDLLMFIQIEEWKNLILLMKNFQLKNQFHKNHFFPKNFSFIFC